MVQAYLFIEACSFLRLFRHNFAENGPQDLKNGHERRVSKFYTICDENQLINKNIDKVMASLVLTCTLHRIRCTGFRCTLQ
jgi:hypothetical protein